jgi:hypothetical protein
MAARALLLLANMDNGFYGIEKEVLTDSGNPEKLEEAERMLVGNDFINAKQIRAIKITAPKALVYLKFFGVKKD